MKKNLWDVFDDPRCVFYDGAAAGMAFVPAPKTGNGEIAFYQVENVKQAREAVKLFSEYGWELSYCGFTSL